jgi:predicted ATPase with chaperone activity
MWGPTRVGKSRLARWLTTIRPAMSRAEALVTTRIPRGAGRTGDRVTFVTTRPCRAPHHTIADVGRIGGGHVPRPGEVSRAHHGVRFLDARPECRRHVLEVLRQPLEEGVLWIQSRGRPASQHSCRLSRTADGHERSWQRTAAAHHHRNGPDGRRMTASPLHSCPWRRLVLFA